MKEVTEAEFNARRDESRRRREEREKEERDRADHELSVSTSEEKRIANIKRLGPDRTSACVTGGPRMSPEGVKAIIDGMAAQQNEAHKRLHGE
jgi:hypothetical protein